MARVATERGVSIERAAELLAAEGVAGFDASYADKNLDRYAATAIKPVNLYGFIKFNGQDGGAKESARFVDTAVRLGVPRIMCIPNEFPGGVESEEEYAKMRDGLAKLVALAKGKGIAVTVEDFGGNPKSPCSYGKYLKRFMQDIPDLKFTVDSGNLYYAGRGEDIRDMVSFAKGRIAHVHLKDQSKENNRSYVTVGLGGVPNEDIVRAMEKDGYNGWYTLENQVGDDHLADVVRQVAVVRHWCKAAR
jgi:sugar phosphate isomerase/epimerase